MSLNWTEYINIEERVATGTCQATAIRNGHTVQEAEDCEAGSVGCPDCPFTPEGRFYRMCVAHDTTFTFSDDSRSYDKGRASWDRIVAAGQTLGIDKARAIWNKVIDLKVAAGSREMFYWRES